MDKNLVELLNEEVTAIDLKTPSTLSSITEKVGIAKLIFLGETSHGTKEFYLTRIELSKQLIEKKAFKTIALECDWFSSYQLHRYIQGDNFYKNAEQALASLEKFPQWEWCNDLFLAFLKWCRNYNDQIKDKKNKIGIYGLELFSLHLSIRDIVNYLQTHSPTALVKFDPTTDIDPSFLSFMISQKNKNTCINKITEQFINNQNSNLQLLQNTSLSTRDLSYYRKQNKLLCKNARECYSSMFGPMATSWNIRNRHMMQTLDNLIDYLEDQSNIPAKIITWSHNSHIGLLREAPENG